MAHYKHIEIELQRMREAKEVIERQLADLQKMIDRTARKVAQQEAGDPTAGPHEQG